MTAVHRLPFNNFPRGIPVVVSRRINDSSIFLSRTRNLDNLRSINRYCGPSSQDANYLSFCTINTQSLNNKAAEFTDFICDYKPDVVTITETWFHVNESAARVMYTPTGYNLLDHSRAGTGGTAIMFRDNLSVCQCTAGEFQSFEYSEWKITSGTQRIHMIIICRPPYSEAHPTTTSVFLAEFSQYLESAVLCTDQLLISGDFNIHVDVTDDSDADFADSLTVLAWTNMLRSPHMSAATPWILSSQETLTSYLFLFHGLTNYSLTTCLPTVIFKLRSLHLKSRRSPTGN